MKYLGMASCTWLLLGVLAARPVQAGIVNVQSVLAVKAEEGLSGSITGALDLRTGNTERFLFSLAPVARYRLHKHLLIGYGSSEYDSNSDLGKVFGHLRYRYAVLEWLRTEVFTQGELDQSRDLELRALLGGGPMILIFDEEQVRLSWGVAYMLEYEEVKNIEDPGLQHRISSYLTGSYELAPHLQVVETVYVQPSLLDPEDVRMLNQSSLVVTASPHLAFTTSFSLAYDTRPDPATLERQDITLQSSITYNF